MHLQTALTFVDGDFLLCLVAKGSVLLYNTHHSWNCVIFKALILASKIYGAGLIQLQRLESAVFTEVYRQAG